MNDAIGTTLSDAATPATDGAAAREGNHKTSLADALRTHFAGDAPLTEKAASFAKARPWTSVALLGVAAVAVLNTLRGRG